MQPLLPTMILCLHNSRVRCLWNDIITRGLLMCTCVDAQGEEVYMQFIFVREDAALLILI